MLQVSLFRLHPKAEITAQAFFDIEDFLGNILLALVLLGVAKESETLDLKTTKTFFQEIYNP